MTNELLQELSQLLIALRTVRRKIYQIVENELERSGNSWEYFQLIQIEENILKSIKNIGILVYPEKTANDNTIIKTENGNL